jgi:hypothetical protein
LGVFEVILSHLENRCTHNALLVVQKGGSNMGQNPDAWKMRKMLRVKLLNSFNQEMNDSKLLLNGAIIKWN